MQVQWEISPDGDLQGEQTIGGDQVNLDLGEYLDPGDYTITLTAIDPRGDNGSDTVNFTVKPNEPPTATLWCRRKTTRLSLAVRLGYFCRLRIPMSTT